MEDTMGDFKLILLIVMVIVLVTVLLYSIIIVSKKKQYYTKIDELDYFKHEISNKTVPFELAKLRSTKKSERIVKMVQQWEQRWGKLEAQFITVTEQIIYAEELVSQRSFSEVDELLEETHQQLEGLNQEVEGLLNEIKELKKSEERSRSNVLGLKEHFEQLKIQYEGEIDQFTECKEEIKLLFKDIESLFFKFNECMEDCNYDVADETIATIKKKMKKVTIIFDRVPIYLTSIKTEIRPLLKDVLKSYENLTQSGVYLKHLEIEETISIYKEQLSQMTDLIKQFEFEQIETRLMEMSQDAKQMITFMKKELEIQDSLTAGLKEVKESISKMNKQADHLSQRYDNIKSNYTLPEEDEDNFNFILNEVKIITNKYEFLEKNAQQKQTANSILCRELDEILNQMDEIEQQLNIFEHEIENLYAGEKEARQRALKLLKAFNDLKGYYQQVKLPVKNDEIKQMMGSANQMMMSLFETIGQMPINITAIEEQLKTAEDMIQMLSFKVEKEVQQLKLAERLMVYGHRYIGREGMYVVDLTIAEDQFRQGNYETVIHNMKDLIKTLEGSAFDFTFDQFKQELDCYLL